MSSSCSTDNEVVSVQKIWLMRLPGFLHLVAKWFLPPHWQHFWPHTGHFPFSNGWTPRQKRQDFRDLSFLSFFPFFLLKFGGCNVSFFSFIRLTSSEVFVPEIIYICDALVSELLQMLMHLFSVRFCSCRSRFLVCGFWVPKTILSGTSDSRMHSQKLHVCERVRNAATYASKVSSGDWFRQLNT